MKKALIPRVTPAGPDKPTNPIKTMKKKSLLLGIIAPLLATEVTNAATIFDNSSPTNSLIQNADNWDNGLPTSANPGTINIDAQYTTGSGGTMTGYFITQTGGLLDRASGATFNLVDGSYTLDGASAEIIYNGLGLTNTVFTVMAGTGTARTGSLARGTNISGGSLQIDGGSMTFNREVSVNGTGQLIVNGGALTVNAGPNTTDSDFRADAAGAGNVGFIFNGGTTVATQFNLANTRTAQFGGTTAGTLSLGSLGTNVTLDWLTGSLMELSITGFDDTSYETLWTDTTLRFNGGNTGSFSDHFSVSGNTLSLIPEPSSSALFAGGLAAMMLRRRRCS